MKLPPVSQPAKTGRQDKPPGEKKNRCRAGQLAAWTDGRWRRHIVTSQLTSSRYDDVTAWRQRSLSLNAGASFYPACSHLKARNETESQFVSCSVWINRTDDKTKDIIHQACHFLHVRGCWDGLSKRTGPPPLHQSRCDAHRFVGCIVTYVLNISKKAVHLFKVIIIIDEFGSLGI